MNNAAGQVKAFVYDNLDRATSLTDANEVTINQTFDNLDRLLTRSYPDTGLEQFAYCPRGLTRYTNQLTFVTSYRYDESSRNCQ